MILEQEKRIKFYKELGYTDEQIEKRLKQIQDLEKWEKKVLNNKPIIPRLAKAGNILKWTEVGLILLTFLLSHIESVENFIKGNLKAFAIYLIVNFILLTIGFVLSQINIRNETYKSVKESKERSENIKKQLGE